MRIKQVLIAAFFAVALAAPLSAESKWVEEFLRRYQPLDGTTSSAKSDMAQMLQTGTMPIAMGDLLNLMIDNNLDIQSNRYSPRSSYYSSLVFYRALQPNITFSGNVGRNTSQNTTQLNGAIPFISQLTDNVSVSFAQSLKTGTSVSAVMTMNRQSSTALTNAYNPSYTGRVTYTVGQHLLRDRGRFVNTRLILQAENQQKMSETNFEISVIAMIVQAQKAYWDLVFAGEDLKIKQQSLDVAQRTLEENEMKVEIGTLARIDVIQTKSDVATRRDALVTSTFGVTTAEDQIKKLVSADKNPSMFLLKFAAKDSPMSPAGVVLPSLEDAVRQALENRPEMRNAALDLKIKQIDEQYTANQKLPILDLTGTYNQNGIGGTQTARAGIGGSITGTVPGGLVDSFRNLFSYNYNGYSVGFTFSIPLSNRANIADHDRATTERQLSEAKTGATAQSIMLEVRNALQQVELNRARIETAQVALDLEQQRLDAEKTKFDLGTSTLRFVLEEQRNLAQAQTTELQTRINFAKSLIDMDKALGNTLNNNKIDVGKALQQSSLTDYKVTVTPAANQK